MHILRHFTPVGRVRLLRTGRRKNIVPVRGASKALHARLAKKRGRRKLPFQRQRPFYTPALPSLRRCRQPTQQQGRRLPSSNSVITRSTWRRLVSGFTAVMVQQIHSFRANGVRSSHRSAADSSAIKALFKSPGNACTVPPVSLPVIII